MMPGCDGPRPKCERCADRGWLFSNYQQQEDGTLKAHDVAWCPEGCHEAQALFSYLLAEHEDHRRHGRPCAAWCASLSAS